MPKREILFLNLQKQSDFPDKEILSAGWAIHSASTIEDATTLIARKDFLIGLICLTEHSPLDTLEEFLLAHKTMEWLALIPSICLSSRATCRFIMENLHDYHTLPVDPMRLVVMLGHTYGKVNLKRKLNSESVADGSYEMIGRSPIMQEFYRSLRKMHAVDTPVLITGESGTGKEMAAQAIHQHSSRARNPFVAVNCGALPSHLIQSELFGHEKGAFTGAFRRKIGQIEAATRGTIFLDEIGDLPLELQVNLLRFLQEKTVQRIGSNQPVPVDVRVIAATNVDLENAVKQGRFREDLYYRLNVLRLRVPPLREREGDIELLALKFLEEASQERNREVKGFSKQAVRAMYSYDWPGNVRELINRVRQAAIMTESRLITPSDLGLYKQATTKHVLSLDTARQKAEMEAIQLSLQRNQNNVSRTADQLGISRVTLYRLMNKFEISLHHTGNSG